MANFKEIVTKAVIGKAKKTFSNKYTMIPSEKPSTILGCWVINHTFKGYRSGEKIALEGSCDINIWYSYDNDTKTIVSKDTIRYQELLSVNKKTESDLSNNEEIIVRSLRQPSCANVSIVEGKIEYNIEKELGIEIVGDTKVRIAIDDNEDEWEELVDDKVEEEIDNSVTEDFLEDE